MFTKLPFPFHCRFGNERRECAKSVFRFYYVHEWWRRLLSVWPPLRTSDADVDFFGPRDLWFLAIIILWLSFVAVFDCHLCVIMVTYVGYRWFLWVGPFLAHWLPPAWVYATMRLECLTPIMLVFFLSCPVTRCTHKWYFNRTFIIFSWCFLGFTRKRHTRLGRGSYRSLYYWFVSSVCECVSVCVHPTKVIGGAMLCVF